MVGSVSSDQRRSDPDAVGGIVTGLTWTLVGVDLPHRLIPKLPVSDDSLPMSSVAVGPETIPRRGLPRSFAELTATRGSEIILGVPIALLAIIALVQLPREVNVDSWLELVTGRLVWQSGLPHHEILTAMSHGRVWIDQQWLAQLAAYAIYRVGGLGLLGLVNAALLGSGIAIGVLATRRLGAPFRSTLIILPLCLTLMMPSRELRTQAFAVPLFMLLVYLLAHDSRQPSRRVLWCLPLLVLWANVHGTVTLGAILVALHGVVTLFERRRSLRGSLRAWRRPLALILGAGVAILVTPYGLAMIGYYRTTMASSTLRHAVSEWQPVTGVAVTAVATFLLAAVAIWSFGRRPSATTTWEKLAVVVLAASTIAVVRNAVFLGLLGMMVIPVSLAWGPRAAARQADPRRTLVNGSIGALTGLVLIVAAIATLARSSASVEYSVQHPGVLAAVERVTRADPTVRVMSDERFDDWLLWRDPALAGRIANDVRFETLTAGQLASLFSLFGALGPQFKQAARGYRLLVLDKQHDGGAWAAFQHELGRRVLYNDGTYMVLLRTAAATAGD